MIIYSRTALATDAEGNLTRLKTVGAKNDAVKTYDENFAETMDEILNQLRIMNFHLGLITENQIEEIGE